MKTNMFILKQLASSDCHFTAKKKRRNRNREHKQLVELNKIITSTTSACTQHTPHALLPHWEFYTVTTEHVLYGWPICRYLKNSQMLHVVGRKSQWRNLYIQNTSSLCDANWNTMLVVLAGFTGASIASECCWNVLSFYSSIALPASASVQQIRLLEN